MTTQIDAGSYSTLSYPAPEIGPGQPLLAPAGGTGVSNPVGATLAFTGATVLSPSVPATATLTVTAGAGVSTPTVTGPTLLNGGSSIGSVVRVKTTVSFTATASTATFTIGIPTAILTNVFTNASQANGVANVIGGTSLGNLTALASVSSARTVTFTFALGSGAGTYTVNLDFAFFVN